MAKSKKPSYAEFSAFTRDFSRWIQPDCPECADAKLYKNGDHHFPDNCNIENIKDLYTCEKCQKEFIPL